MGHDYGRPGSYPVVPGTAGQFHIDWFKLTQEPAKTIFALLHAVVHTG
jgi:hypothetical protein